MNKYCLDLNSMNSKLMIQKYQLTLESRILRTIRVRVNLKN